MNARGALVWLAAAGCRAPPPPAFHLDRHPEALEALSLPPGSRPEGSPPPEEVPLQGPFREVWAEEGLARYEAALPVHGVFWGHSDKVPPPGLAVVRADGTPVTYDADRAARPLQDTWRAWEDTVWIRPARGRPAPTAGEYRVRYPPGARTEETMNLALTGRTPEVFALRSVAVAHETRRGVLLPAPAEATWTVPAPRGAVLDLEARILLPAADEGPASDGAGIGVSVQGDDGWTELATLPVDAATWTRLTVKLPRSRGSTARLHIGTAPGGDPLLDYVFVADPVVHVPRRHPRRLLLVFVDTLRRDHVGLYGSERDTTPRLDAWARDAVVFDDARSTAPWTLPSVRSTLSGVAPDRWDAVASLPERLSDAGWTTAAFVNNAYLSGETGMEEGWDRYRYRLLESATAQVDLATAFLRQHDRQDVAVLVQFMDPHLPYREPARLRRFWAGDAPAGLPEAFGRADLTAVQAERREEVRPWVLARYDQNVRYVDDEVSRLLADFGDDATVVFFSDHGEEFWEHGGVEHGHALWDELLRVPLILRAPGLRARRVSTPVSLRDLAPTLLDLLGLPVEGLEGRSLLPLARGDRGAAEALAHRPLPAGDTLYDTDAWGVVLDGRKWIARAGRQSVFDLAADPEEQEDVAPASDLGAWHRALAGAWDREAVVAWRLEGRGRNRIAAPAVGSLALCRSGGFLRAWYPYDAAGRAAVPVLDGECVRVSSLGTAGLPREIYALPAGDPLDPTGAVLEVAALDGTSTSSATVPAGPLDPTAGPRQMLLEARHGAAAWTVDLQVVPAPPDAPLPSGAPRLLSHLEALGYVE